MKTQLFEKLPDCRLLTDILPQNVESRDVLSLLKEEVAFQEMFQHGGPVPRLICIQAECDSEGRHPIYRHPSDEMPAVHKWTPTVDKIRKALEAAVGESFNHALIQLYRGGQDFIGEHSDKTLDIAHGSSIVNYSVGATRQFVLRRKKSNRTADSEERDVLRIDLVDNSAFVLGPVGNREWLHAIRQDKRPDFQKRDDELSHHGERISLTFRRIDTFVTPDNRIFGQGAGGVTEDQAIPIRVVKEEVVKLLHCFRLDNQCADFDWNENYGKGFFMTDCREVAE
jgi:alkylated DNA repair dioxygenase AlkB